MKIPFVAILKWIGSTLLTAAIQQGAERIVRSRQTGSAGQSTAEQPDSVVQA